MRPSLNGRRLIGVQVEFVGSPLCGSAVLLDGLGLHLGLERALRQHHLFLAPPVDDSVRKVASLSVPDLANGTTTVPKPVCPPTYQQTLGVSVTVEYRVG